MSINSYFQDFRRIVVIPPLPPPSLPELQEYEPAIGEIEKDTSPSGIILLDSSVLIESGEEFGSEPWAAGQLNLNLGYQQAKWLFHCSSELPRWMSSWWRVYFSGTVVLGAGQRLMPCLYQFDGFLYLVWHHARIDSRVRRVHVGF